MALITSRRSIQYNADPPRANIVAILILLASLAVGGLLTWLVGNPAPIIVMALLGVILVGAILVAGSANSSGELILALVAVALAAINMVGGFVVTDRMLEMFGRGAPAARSSRQGKPANGDSGEAA